jgi:hypothetical protein
LFDEAELSALLDPTILASTLLSLSISAANRAAEVIPKRSAWVDNYISLVGIAQPRAANVLLWRNASLDLIGAHGYSYMWYSNSMFNPFGLAGDSQEAVRMGNRWSFERNTIADAPKIGSYHVQAINLNLSTMELYPLDPVPAAFVAYPSLTIYRGYSAVKQTVKNIPMYVATEAIEHLGDLTQSFIEAYNGTRGEQTGIGADNPSPTPVNASGGEGKWDLELRLQGPSTGLQTAGIASSAQDAGPGTLFMDITVSVPTDAIGLSFDYAIENAGTEEFFSMGITNEVLYSVQASLLVADEWRNSGLIDLTQYGGANVKLSFLLSGPGEITSKLKLKNLTFHVLGSPVLAVENVADSLILSWPSVSTNWTLESTGSLSEGWKTITNAPLTSNLLLQHIATNSGSGAGFFRLSK